MTTTTYRAVGARRTNRWRLGAPLEVRHEGREFGDPESAILSARSLARRYGGAWAVEEVRDHYRTRRIAQVSSDALGRLWTDVMTGPAEPALI